MRRYAQPTALTALILMGAMFGFFYAWICSTMWGLDAADPRVAIAAMREMNASVRNIVFAVPLAGTPIMLLLAALLARGSGAGRWFVAAAATYVILGFGLTQSYNVPLNMELAQGPIPQAIEEAREIWQAYSERWQFWNIMRTIACGFALVMTGIGLLKLGSVNVSEGGVYSSRLSV